MNCLRLIEHEYGIVEVVLDRPEVHNAFDDQMIAELKTTFDTLSKDDSIRVVILSASGKSFSAGADLNWMRRMADYSFDENYDDSLQLAHCLYSIYKMPCPVIAQVQGAAFGGGVGLVACCDIAVASNQASFCLSEVKLGLIPAVISPYVIQALGSRNAKHYFMTAEKFNAEKALQMNLVSAVCEPDSLIDEVMKKAREISQNGPNAVREAKRLVQEVADQPINQKLNQYTARCIAEVRSSDEGKEGVSAFLSKCPPSWNEETD